MLILADTTLGSALNTVLLAIDAVVYGLINSAFKIFMAIAGARLLSSDAYTTIANKIYIIIGVVMLFVLAYAIIRAIIDPDQMTKGDLSGPKLLKNIVVAVIGLAIAPVLFNMMYQAQSLFLEHDVLVKLFFRGGEETVDAGDAGIVNVDAQIKNVGGGVTSVTLWKAFFYPNGVDPDEVKANVKDYWVNAAVSATSILVCLAGIAGGVALAVGSYGTLSTLAIAASLAACGYGVVQGGIADKKYELMQQYGDDMSLTEAYAYASAEGDFGIFTAFVDNIANKEIKYMIIVSLICGGFVCYAFVTFSIDMGIRAAKLAYYQIIAPIPLILQVLPKWKDSFSKYLKDVISTFVEVFIRISVVYIIVYIICHLESLFSNVGELFGNDNLNAVEGLIAYALLIIGLVIFAKQAPDMISKTFGLEKGSMSLGIKDKLQKGGVFTAGAAIGAGVTSGVRNLTHAFKDPKNWQNKDGKVNGRSVLNNVARGLFSGGAGAVSGAVRGGYNAKGAKGFKDMAGSASYGAKKAVEARDNREVYAESHPNVVWGHITDNAKSVARWAGFDSLEGLEKTEKALTELDQAKGNLKSKAKSVINGHADGNKTKNYGITAKFKLTKYNDGKTGEEVFTDADIAGLSQGFSTSTYKSIKDAVEAARHTSDGRYKGHSLAQWQALSGKYEADFADELQNMALLSRDSWSTLGGGIKADIGDVRDAAVEFREALRKNLGTSWVAEANVMAGHTYGGANGRIRVRDEGDYEAEIITTSSIDGDLHVNGSSALNKIGDVIVNERQEVRERKAEIRKKQEASKNGEKK